MLLRLALTLLWPVAALVAQRDPGSTTAFRWEPLGADLQIFVPRDYDPATKWPVVVHFHGTGGFPNLGPAPAATDGKGFVVVGTTYLTRGLFRAEAEAVEQEWAATKAAVTALADELGLDLDRIYVSGFSKGGWVAGMIFEQFPDEIAGAWIGGAGIATAKRRLPKARELPVYVGVGETDVNRIASLQAVPEWRKERDALVTYDEYPGVGHSFEITDRCRAWFEVERLRGTDLAEPQRTAMLKVGALLALGDGGQGESPVERYRRLDRLQDDPWVLAAGEESRQAIADLVDELADEPALKAEVQARKAYERVLDQEISERGKPVRARSVADADKKVRQRKEKLLKRYQQVADRYPDTTYGKKAAADVQRVTVHLAQIPR